jgi:ubiquinone/menaquinone biosynthesis C-methylase UbiE
MRRALALAGLALLLWPGCTAWKRCAYEGRDRDAWQKPGQVVAALEIAPGSRVADLGAGSGYFTLHLARAVGPQGRVWAADVDEEMNAFLRERVAEAGLANVEVVLAGLDDPKLPDGEIDLVFTSNTYHHIEARPDYFRRLRADLAPGARVAVIEYDGRGGLFATLFGHHTGKELILREMQEAGYVPVADFDFLERQSFLVFRPGPGLRN